MNYAWKVLLLSVLSIPFAVPASGTELGCSASAQMLYAACGFDASDDFFSGKAQCLDSSDPIFPSFPETGGCTRAPSSTRTVRRSPRPPRS